MSKRAATFCGVAALAMWGMLATLTSFAGAIPPFQLTSMALGIGGLIGVVSWMWRPGVWRVLRAPWHAWALGLFGLFGYHFAYFTALKLAPAVDASLIAYLWPLLIVLFSSLLPGQRLHAVHLIGAGLGFIGAGLLVSGGAGFSPDSAYVAGYLAALACAFIWSSYSVLSRLLGAVSSDSIAGFCLVAAGLALIAHLGVETTIWPGDIRVWLAILLLGVFPTGLAFYAWDVAMKHGDIQLLGVLSYATPVISTLLLAVFGQATLTPTVLIAMALVTLGAVIAARKSQG